MKIHLHFLIALFISFHTLKAQEMESKQDDKSCSVYLAQDFLLTFSVNYERTFSLDQKNYLGGRLALANDGGNKSYGPACEVIYLYGSSKHFLETGIGYYQPVFYMDEGPDNPMLSVNVGYRYQAPKGFLLKVYPEFLPPVFGIEEGGSIGWIPVWLGFALGYSF